MGAPLRAELDYLSEGRNADRFAANFAGDTDVHIPHVHWDTTTTRVLTLERIRGIKISDLAGLDVAGIDRPGLAARATRVTAQMIFENGFFHGDPHPGNFFVHESGRIGVIDFGTVGTIDQHLREQLGRVLVAAADHDADRVTDARHPDRPVGLLIADPNNLGRPGRTRPGMPDYWRRLNSLPA